jgi:hypothetical protein
MLFMIAFSATVFAVQQTPLALRQAVADDIQGLLDDTVNEGYGTAEVLEGQDGPAVECKISGNLKEPGLKWAYCTVSFEVTWEDDSAFRDCGLLYKYDPASISKSLERGDDETFDSCLENLSEGL